MLEKFVPLLATADEVNSVAVLIKVLNNVPDLVLENRVHHMKTARRANPVVALTKNVP